MSALSINDIFLAIQKSNQLLRNDIPDLIELDALSETLQNMVEGNEAQVVEGLPKEETVKQLNKIYQDLDIQSVDPKDIHKALEMAILQATKLDKLQANHQLTPDAIAMLFTYFAKKLAGEKIGLQETFKIGDYAVGTGNLLSNLLLSLEDDGIPYQAYGGDNDDLLIALADKSFQLQGLDVDLTIQDSLQVTFAESLDLLVSDLPFGYYPVEEVASSYQTAAMEGYSFTHYLFIEQAFNYLKEGGWAILMIPSTIFADEQAKGLVETIQNQGHLQAFLNLPSDLFQESQASKSILILQKKGPNAKQAEKTLAGAIPSLKDLDKLSKFLTSFTKWVKDMI